MRIALAGISHEALPSSPLRARRDDFRVVRGDEIFAEHLPSLSTGEADFVPILVAASPAPSGPVDHATYLAFRDEILTGVRSAAPLDGVCLILHGAMQVEGIGSGEADLVTCIREAIGPQALIAARFDLHANISDTFAQTADLWTAFRTAPHRDIRETNHRALSLLLAAVRRGMRPVPVFVRVPLLLQGEKATTDVDPMRTLEAHAREIEEIDGILTAEIAVGFGWSDSEDASSSITVIADSASSLDIARTHAARLAAEMWGAREQFHFDMHVVPDVSTAVNLALAAPEASVWLTDSGDNPTAGTPGDSTYFLRELLACNPPDAVFAAIPDAESYTRCASAGVGATVQLHLGANWDATHSAPLDLTARVIHLSPGDPSRTISPAARVRVANTDILITQTRRVYASPEDFHEVNIDPLAHKIVVVKQGYLLPALRQIAPKEILVTTPGYSDMDLARLPYTHLRRPIFPLDGEFNWSPA